MQGINILMWGTTYIRYAHDDPRDYTNIKKFAPPY